MTELLTAAQMREIEKAAIESGTVSGLELMERAGQGVVDVIFKEWPELDRRVDSSSPTAAGTDGGNDGSRSPENSVSDEEGPLRAVVLCGPGNNGGDGFVVARLLKKRGWDVEVYLFGAPEKLPPDARANYDRLAGHVEVAEWSAEAILNGPAASLYIDAIFGAGLTRAPSAEILGPLSEIYASGRTFGRMVCVDAPTGLCMDSGRALSDEYGAVYGFLTVTFHRMRLGHVLGDGPSYCGEVRVVDIGLGGACEDAVRLLDDGSAFAITKASGDHKYDHGHALILSGGPGKTGAARLAARGALRIGAGLVTLGVPPAAQMEVASQITAIMLKRVEDADALSGILQDKRLNALCLGPGLGPERARELVPVALSGSGETRPTVLDADALSAFAENPETLFESLHEDCVVTPHGGEFSRLFPDLAKKMKQAPTKGPAYSKVDATREAARRAGCVVLFKGPDTVIAAPDGQCSIHAAFYERAAQWLATAGSGDVLAGFITGLLARGFTAMDAAETAAWLHVEAAREFGAGLIAEDLPEQLPAIMRRMDIA